MQDTLSGQAGAQGSLQGLDARERVPPGVGLEICARGAGKSGRFDPFGRLDGQGDAIPCSHSALVSCPRIGYNIPPILVTH